MAKESKNIYNVFDNYYLRTPLISFSSYKKWIEKSQLIDSDFTAILKDPVFIEALYLASPELINQVIKWENKELTDEKKVKKLQITLLKYYTRIATRCTPFGLFSSCALGVFDKNNSVILKKNLSYNRFTNYDYTFLTQLSRTLINDINIREQILFFPNSSVYKIGNHYRYIGYSVEKNTRNYFLEGFNFSNEVEKILTYSKNGSTINQLAFLLTQNDVSLQDAKKFINQLIDNQILVSDLDVTITGTDYLKALTDKVKRLKKTSKTVNFLTLLKKYLIELDNKIGNTPNDYQIKINNIREIISTEFASKYLFQTECFTNYKHNSLDKGIKKKLLKTILLFNKLTLASANVNIEEFKRKFTKRFQESEVPLSLALDTETGIGYGNNSIDDTPILDKLSLTETEKKRYKHIVWTDVDSIIHNKLEASIRNNDYIIKLTENDFEEISCVWNDLPDTFSAIIEVYNVNNNVNIFFNESGGSSAINVLGRFACKDSKLAQHISNIVSIEDSINKNKILAEIIHIPEERTGNILQRPSLRKYEIPLLSKSSRPIDYQVLIEDLFIRVVNNKITLRSKKLNKEVIPYLSNAHNYYYNNSLPIYKFLCDIQTQDKRTSIGFNWNPILENHFFLPRIVFENVILSKARWNIVSENFKQYFINKKIHEWQLKNNIPNLVELVQGDNRLLVNLANNTSIEMLLETIKNKKQFILEELLFGEDEIVKNTESQSFCNQVVVSFYKEKIKKD